MFGMSHWRGRARGLATERKYKTSATEWYIKRGLDNIYQINEWGGLFLEGP